MAKQKTIPELQAEIAVKERQIAQLQHKQQQLENRRSYYRKGDRRKWAHHLITRGEMCIRDSFICAFACLFRAAIAVLLSRADSWGFSCAWIV